MVFWIGSEPRKYSDGYSKKYESITIGSIDLSELQIKVLDLTHCHPEEHESLKTVDSCSSR